MKRGTCGEEGNKWQRIDGHGGRWENITEEMQWMKGEREISDKDSRAFKLKVKG